MALYTWTLSTLNDRFRRVDGQLWLFLAGVVLLGITSGIFETTFNNFLNDTFNISAEARGQLEFPRELPGFLVAITAGLLFFLTEMRMAALSALCTAVGMGGLALLSPSFGCMMIWMILWSLGNHLIMPLRSSIGLSLAREGRGATRLGQIGGIGIAATIIGAGLVWIGFDYLHFNYTLTFFAGGATALLASANFLRMRPRGLSGHQRTKFVFKRRYRLFYLLSALFGARKQVFITFGPWVLIRVFGAPAQTIAKLWIVSSVIGIFFRPQLGKAIDRFGERVVLMLDAVLLFGICIGYGFSQQLGLGERAVYVAYVCYMLDLSLFAVTMARTTYLHKILENKDDLTPSLSTGVSIDHAVSMVVPTFGGLIWVHYGYPYVFLCAAGLAVLMFISASRVREASSNKRRPRSRPAKPFR